jgi:hypothetical protein
LAILHSNLQIHSFQYILRQQKELDILHRKLGDELISISLDIDPNEDEFKVKEYIERNEFAGYYAISPTNLTQELINEFGLNIINTPIAPVVIICPNKKFTLLTGGVKTAHFIESKIKLRCG